MYTVDYIYTQVHTYVAVYFLMALLFSWLKHGIWHMASGEIQFPINGDLII